MNFGVTKHIANGYMGNIYRQNKLSKQVVNSTFFNALANTSSARDTTQISFEEMWKSQYPNSKYHSVDASRINRDIWCRNDFPSEAFFDDVLDKSVLDWKPNGADKNMADQEVQTRLNSTLGKKSILVPPELEEKMKNNPELAKNVMSKVQGFIETHPVPLGRVSSYLISLDKNGDIAQFRVTSGGGTISEPSKEDLLELINKQKRKVKLRSDYEYLAENAAIERKKYVKETDVRSKYF